MKMFVVPISEISFLKCPLNLLFVSFTLARQIVNAIRNIVKIFLPQNVWNGSAHRKSI